MCQYGFRVVGQWVARWAGSDECRIEPCTIGGGGGHARSIAAEPGRRKAGMHSDMHAAASG